MAVMSTLVAFGLRQVSIDSADTVMDRVGAWFFDAGLDLHRAVRKANDRTWHTVALALGGEGWLERLRGFFHQADIRGLRDQVKAFLREAGVSMEGLTGVFRRNCLDELHQLKRAGRLGADRLDPGLVAKQVRDYRRYTDPLGLAEEARLAAGRLAEQLHAEAPHLAEFVRLPLAANGAPLLVTAFSYYLRQEIVSRPSMVSGMLLEGAEQLYARQAAGFEHLREALGWMEDRLDVFMGLVHQDLDELARTTRHTAVVVDEVLRLLQEQQERERLGHSPRTTPVRRLMEQARDRPAGTRWVGPLDMVFAWVPAGSFVMGSPPDEPGRDADEVPHRVTIRHGFWLGVYPVTRRQWWGLMRTMPEDTPADDHPIGGLSWHECEEFLDCLAERDPRPFRLPTEAEWEYACRAGTVGPFAFGRRLSSEQANFHAGQWHEALSARPAVSRGGTTPVGTFPPNAWGLCDMHGNVMEWCRDRYGPYPMGDVADPEGPATGEVRVLRGGAWWSPVQACRSARRYSASPAAAVLPAGFRVVLEDRET